VQTIGLVATVALALLASPGAVAAAPAVPAQPVTDAAVACTPAFDTSPCTLAVAIAGTGRVTSNPAGIDCPAVACSAPFARICESHCLHAHTRAVGHKVTLAAHGFLWSWSGDCSRALGQAANECTVSVDPDKTVTAVFGAAADTAPPSAPAVAVTPRRYSFVASWQAATDDHWVGGYDVFLNGKLVQRLPGSAVTTKVDADCATAYTLRVLAFDAADNRAGSEVAAKTEPCLRELPETYLDVHPAKVTQARNARFRFHSSKPRSSFACRLDRGTWSRCTSPKLYRNLAPGSHAFRVRAIDAEGHADPTPVVWRWRVTR
jgi:hypothetical protein